MGDDNRIPCLLRGCICAVAFARLHLRGGRTELIGNELSHAEFHALYRVALTLQEKSFVFRIFFLAQTF